MRRFIGTAVAALVLMTACTTDVAPRDDDTAVDGPAAGATVEQLLLHTSGLTGSHGQDHEPLSRAAAIASISALEQAFEPGTDHLYSNAEYTLLALIVEEESGP